MAGILYPATPYGLFTFVLITLVLGGLGALAAGRALAQTWRPMAIIAVYMLFLTAGVRFLHYALYGEQLLSVQFFLVAYVWNLIVAALRVSGDAGPADGDTVFLGLRARRAELARQEWGVTAAEVDSRRVAFFE